MLRVCGSASPVLKTLAISNFYSAILPFYHFGRLAGWQDCFLDLQNFPKRGKLPRRPATENIWHHFIKMEAHQGIAKWKVGHPNAPNNIIQMQSGGFQAPFFNGGNQVPNTLGIRGNSVTSELPSRSPYSATERILKHYKN